jgi:hypothetical protein
LVEVHLVGKQLILEPVRSTLPEGQSSLRGLLSEYFSDRDDVEAFITEERNGWEERDQLLEEDRRAISERFRQSSD